MVKSEFDITQPLRAEIGLERIRTHKLLVALENLIAASGHISPFGGLGGVRSVRLAGKYIQALDRAKAVISEIREDK